MKHGPIGYILASQFSHLLIWSGWEGYLHTVKVVLSGLLTSGAFSASQTPEATIPVIRVKEKQEGKSTSKDRLHDGDVLSTVAILLIYF
jgi:hypothetical protein